MQVKKVVLVGGGIGGLSLAVALRNKGMETVVCEKAAEFHEIGSGIVLSPNGVKALDRLGRDIGAEARKQGYHDDSGLPYPFLSWKGKTLFTQSFENQEDKYGAPMISILRSDLHALLLRAAHDADLRVHANLTAFHQNQDGVTASLADGAEITGDILVGADGLRSTVRAQLFGQQPPRYCGMGSVRGVVQGLKHPLAKTGFTTMGPGAQIFSSPIGPDRLYWAATIKAEEGIWPRLTVETAKTKLLARLSNWHAPIQEMIEATDLSTLVLTDIYDRQPLEHWSSGRVTLLGDAAHPMSPFLGQGANTALEDAVRLADAMAQEPDVSSAFARYEQERIERTTRFVNVSRQMTQVGRMENPLACMARDVMTRLMMKFSNAEKQNAWMSEYNP